MKWLLDTVTVSEPVKARPNDAVLRWLDGVEADDLAISAVSLMELERGVVRVHAERSAKLRQWIDHDVRGNIEVLAFDQKCARVAGELQVGPTPPLADSMIAATALVHGLTVVTRNLKDFGRFPVPLFSPWGGK